MPKKVYIIFAGKMMLCHLNFLEKLTDFQNMTEMSFEMTVEICGYDRQICG